MSAEDEQEKKESKGNPILGALDGILKGARKFLADQKMLKLADELTYLALRKMIDGLKNTFIPMKIEGEEFIPAFKPAILASIVEQPVELPIVTGLTARKIHLMVPAEIFNTPGLKPIFEAIGAYRSTTSKDDMEPVQRTVEFLNKEKDLVAMIPIDNGDREIAVRRVAGILKFAAGVPCPLIPYASTSMKNFKLGKSISIKVLEPIEVKVNIKRDERYALASKIVDMILEAKSELESQE